MADLKKIQESFLLVKLIMPDDFPYSMVNNPLYSWDVMVGLVGGMLSLWLGITIMTFVEVFEFFYVFIKNCLMKKT